MLFLKWHLHCKVICQLFQGSPKVAVSAHYFRHEHAPEFSYKRFVRWIGSSHKKLKFLTGIKPTAVRCKQSPSVTDSVELSTNSYHFQVYLDLPSQLSIAIFHILSTLRLKNVNFNNQICPNTT